MIKFKKLAFLLGLLIIISSITACGQPANLEESSESTPAADGAYDDTEPEDESEVESDIDDNLDIGGGAMFDFTIEELTAGLTENQYPGLVIEAVVLERMAILPGSTIRVSVTITNQGDQEVAFVKGSGSNVIPEALKMVSDDLQPILPQEHLGFATMDFVVETLEPGQTLNYSLYLRAVKPSGDFDSHTFQLYLDEMIYIGDLDWEDLSTRFPDLIEVQPGSHEALLYFFYTIIDSDELDIFGMEATGFNIATLEIVVD